MTTTPYDEAVAKNLSHMGTPASEWVATPIKEMVNDGQNPVFPSYDYPSGYSSAPSLFKITGQDCNCELCGHAIKICFALQNDSKQWMLTVGSECVTHFGTGQSGKELASEKQKMVKREFLRTARARCNELDNTLSKQSLCTDEGQKRYNEMDRIRYSLRKLLAGYHADYSCDVRFGKKFEKLVATDAEVSGWYRARKAKIEALLNRLAALPLSE